MQREKKSQLNAIKYWKCFDIYNSESCVRPTWSANNNELMSKKLMRNFVHCWSLASISDPNNTQRLERNLDRHVCRCWCVCTNNNPRLTAEEFKWAHSHQGRNSQVKEVKRNFWSAFSDFFVRLARRFPSDLKCFRQTVYISMHHIDEFGRAKNEWRNIKFRSWLQTVLPIKMPCKYQIDQSHSCCRLHTHIHITHSCRISKLTDQTKRVIELNK